MRIAGRTYHIQPAFRLYRLGAITPEDFRPKPDGTFYTDEEIRAYIKEKEAEGWDCFPCCDNIDDEGHCRGTEEDEPDAC